MINYLPQLKSIWLSLTLHLCGLGVVKVGFKFSLTWNLLVMVSFWQRNFFNLLNDPGNFRHFILYLVNKL